jgi:arylsulfatase A-like enzyme
VVRAAKNGPQAPLSRASTVLVKGRYKLLYFFGYRERGIDELVKLYDVEADPEELVDLSASQKDIASELLGELKAKLLQVNLPYM